MRFFRREVWSYAVLLIILFCIAALATRETISYIESQVSGEETRVVAALIWSLTLGFMLIAGAFGLWAIKFSAEAESRRRIGRFVDTMDYLRDGLLVVDRKGQITGSNPAVAELLKASPTERDSFRDVFPSLSDEDRSLLLDSGEPNEIEHEIPADNGPRLLRFRSQPSDDLIIILISDITQMNAQRLHGRQLARLQLIGQLARGVAHDLNILLTGISGHAILLTRLRPGTPEMARSIEAITQASEQGVTLAGHLLELAQPGAKRSSTDAVNEHVAAAVDTLRDTLPANWKVESSMEGQIPPASLSGLQVEQMVLNLGLLAAEAIGIPGTLRVSAGLPAAKPLFNVGSNYAGVIMVAASTGAVPLPSEEPLGPEISRESGIIQSVIQSMVEEAGGAFYSFMGPDRSVIYRIALPRRAFAAQSAPAGFPEEAKAYLSLWTVLFARPPREYGALGRRLAELGIRVTGVDNIMSALAKVEEDKNLDAMILDRYLLGQEAKGLLRAILKLQPLAGILVLCDDPASESEGLSSDVVFVQSHSDPNTILTSLIEAKNLALRRKPTRRLVGL